MSEQPKTIQPSLPLVGFRLLPELVKEMDKSRPVNLLWGSEQATQGAHGYSMFSQVVTVSQIMGGEILYWRMTLGSLEYLGETVISKSTNEYRIMTAMDCIHDYLEEHGFRTRGAGISTPMHYVYVGGEGDGVMTYLKDKDAFVRAPKIT